MAKANKAFKNIKEAYDQDQLERDSMDWDVSENIWKLVENDIKRQAYAYYLLENELLQTAEDYYHAAMIFHHGDKVSDLALAVSLCQLALQMGNSDAKCLYARAVDRFLLKVGRPQKFGTQFDQKKGKWYLCAYDEATTDAERAEYDVPSLDHQLNVRTKELAEE